MPQLLLETLAQVDKRTIFTISEMAHLFDISVQAVHQWLTTGRIRYSKRTSRRGSYLIPRREVVRLLKKADREVRGLWERPSEPRIKVLLIDDSRPLRQMAVSASKGGVWPYELRVASNAEDGIVLAVAFRPHIVVLDLDLRGDRLSGDQAILFLRRTRLLRTVRILALCTHLRSGKQSIRFGADAYLRKPFGLLELREAVFHQSRECVRRNLFDVQLT